MWFRDLQIESSLNNFIIEFEADFLTYRSAFT